MLQQPVEPPAFKLVLTVSLFNVILRSRSFRSFFLFFLSFFIGLPFVGATSTSG